jgi:eukaryotic-like serine/threonine-protein kinase
LRDTHRREALVPQDWKETQDNPAGPLEHSLMREIAGTPDRLPVAAPRPGEVLADRFTIERFVDSGGMGSVYRALDQMTGKPVALKLMTNAASGDERFIRECRVLSELSHPAIVQHVAHGFTAPGQAFLAMEWLEGEDLRKRLARAGLTVAESLRVVRRVAEGLATAHVRGVVHRDVKPGNVFLVDGDPLRAKLLDFGIVREQTLGPPTGYPMTGTGMVLGTVGYMSPEQATADRALDARSDVFALGCVLFECLTGQPAFSGEQVVAVLAKILRGESRRVRQVRPELPQPLDDLVARMLSKDKAGRPTDGRDLVRQLDALGNVEADLVGGDAPTSPGLSSDERRIVAVMLAVLPDEPDRVTDVVRRHGGDLARLADGAFIVTLASRGATHDQLVTGARCALDLQQTFPSARIALATGWTQSGPEPPGPAIDRAAKLLARSAPATIGLDEVTAGLLGERFDVRLGVEGSTLVGRRGGTEAPRTLLGKATPCVGRDKELTLLHGILRECVDETVARAVLVTGPPGQGKSRLGHEFVATVRESGAATILTASADPVGAGSAFMLVRQLVRDAIRLREGDPAAEQHARVRAYVADVCKLGDHARIADFLGELIGVPSFERPSPQLRAARNDPQIMAAWLDRSFGEWLEAECSARPVLVVLEDLQWGDLPSVTYLDRALASLSAKPLMIFALSRPEVHEMFPNLWKRADTMEIPLGRLTPRAAERLVKGTVGSAITDDAVRRLIQRADGNPFYLEELIRRVIEGDGDELPETVLALIQSRLERLEPEARRIVRAASVFGDVFWRGGVATLLGAAGGANDLDAWLDVLGQREVVTLASESRFPGEREYVFRHALLREAAYAMLVATDRGTGHRLAGEWLQKAGEKDALTVADHFERGGEQQLAVPWLRRAAQGAFEGGNVEAALVLSARGLACGPTDAERADLVSARAQALGLRGDWRGAVDAAREAMPLRPLGSALWFRMAANVLLAGTLLGDSNVSASAIREVLRVSVQPELSGPYGLAVYCTSTAFSRMGRFDLALSFVARAEEAAENAPEPDPVFTLWLDAARAYLHFLTGELASSLACLGHAQVLAERSDYTFGRAVVTHHTLQAMVQTGNHERTTALAHDLVLLCEPLGLSYLIDYGTYALARLALMAGRVPEAVSSFRSLLDRQDVTLATRARAHLALALVARGDLDTAEKEATTAMETGAIFADTRAIASCALARIALSRGRPIDALAFADGGLGSPTNANEGAFLRLSRAEALHSLGRTDDAREAIREARDRIQRLASELGDPALRDSYLANVPANVRTISLAHDWELEDGGVGS